MRLLVCALALWFVMAPVMAQADADHTERNTEDELPRKGRPVIGKGPEVPIPSGISWLYAPDHETAEDYRLRLETQRRMVEDWPWSRRY